jgi:hypothetical protein
LLSIDFLAKNINLESLTLKADTSRKDFSDYDKVLPIDFMPLMNLKQLKYLRIQGFVPSRPNIPIGELPELRYFDADLYNKE